MLNDFMFDSSVGSVLEVSWVVERKIFYGQ